MVWESNSHLRVNISSGETSAAAALLTLAGAAYRWLNPTRDRLDRLEASNTAFQAEMRRELSDINAFLRGRHPDNA